MRKYGGGGWHAPGGTVATAKPTVLANGLAEAQMTRVIAHILMPKYTGNPEDLDEFERTWNEYLNDSAMVCSEAQRQLFCLSMLPHCVRADVKKELDDWVEDCKISTSDEMWRAFSKEKVADLLHHAQRCFKAVSLRTLGGHIRMADWRDFGQEYRHLGQYVKDWTEESGPAQVYNMLPYKLQEKVRRTRREVRGGPWSRSSCHSSSTKACCNGSTLGPPRINGSTR